MRLHSWLPLNRWQSGRIVVEHDDGVVVAGPWACRGKADSQAAAGHHNADRYPTLPYGDHPYGTYIVVAVEPNKQPAHSYGPCFLLLDPQTGDALKAKQNGRTGLGIHAGDPNDDGSLRATEGCLRTTNTAILAIQTMDPLHWTYICDRLEETI